MTSLTKQEILHIPCILTRAAHLCIVRSAVEKARAARPEQRGWICHQSLHYNTPGSTTAAPTSPCRCGHAACQQSFAQWFQNCYPPLASTDNSRITNASAAGSDDAPTPAACFDVQVITRIGAECDGWVCFFCRMYTAGGTVRHDGTVSLVCPTCGIVKEREVVFVKRVQVTSAESVDDGGEGNADGGEGNADGGERNADGGEWVVVMRGNGRKRTE